MGCMVIKVSEREEQEEWRKIVMCEEGNCSSHPAAKKTPTSVAFNCPTVTDWDFSGNELRGRGED